MKYLNLYDQNCIITLQQMLGNFSQHSVDLVVKYFVGQVELQHIDGVVRDQLKTKKLLNVDSFGRAIFSYGENSEMLASTARFCIHYELYDLLAAIIRYNFYTTNIGGKKYLSIEKSSYTIEERSFDRLVELLMFAGIEEEQIIRFAAYCLEQTPNAQIGVYYDCAVEYLTKNVRNYFDFYLSILKSSRKEGYKKLVSILMGYNSSKTIEFLLDNYLYSSSIDRSLLFDTLKNYSRFVLPLMENILRQQKSDVREKAVLLLSEFNERQAQDLLKLQYQTENSRNVRSLIYNEIDKDDDIGSNIDIQQLTEFCQKQLQNLKGYEAVNTSSLPVIRFKDNYDENKIFSVYLSALFYLYSYKIAVKKATEFAKHFRSRDLKNLAAYYYQKWIKTNRRKWTLPLVSAFGDNQTVSALLKHAQELPDDKKNLAAFIIEILGLSGKKIVLDYYKNNGIDSNDKVLAQAVQRGKENFADVTQFTKEDMSNMLLDDYELDSDCTKVFEYNNRIITVGISNSLETYAKDEFNTRYTKFDFPDSRTLTKLLNDLQILTENLKLEFNDALIGGRKWHSRTFVENVLGHIILNKFANNLMWGAYENDNLKKIFFVYQKQLKDTDGQDFELKKHYTVGLVHPLEIPPHILDRINAKFKVQLDQTTRKCYSVDAHEGSMTVIKTYSDTIFDYNLMLDFLTQRGYVSGIKNKNSGMYEGFFKLCKNRDMLAYLNLNQDKHTKSVTLKEVSFYKLSKTIKRKNIYCPYSSNALALNDVDKIFYSETLYDIKTLLDI